MCHNFPTNFVLPIAKQRKLCYNILAHKHIKTAADSFRGTTAVFIFLNSFFIPPKYLRRIRRVCAKKGCLSSLRTRTEERCGKVSKHRVCVHTHTLGAPPQTPFFEKSKRKTNMDTEKKKPAKNMHRKKEVHV